MGTGFSVGRGVRLYGGSRGLGVSVGAGPFRLYSGTGRGRRSTRSSGRTSVAAYERQVRQQQRINEIQGQIALDAALLRLCSVHTEEFVPAQRWTAPGPEPVDREALCKRLEDEATQGISLLKVRERRQAKRRAVELLEPEVAAETARRERERQATQIDLDRSWEALLANNEQVVLSMLEAAFEDNETPAAAVSCRGTRVDLLMRWPTLDEVVPERKADVTPTGQPTTRKRNKTERVEFYLWALASNALVTVKEALAVSPAITELGVAVVRRVPDPARGDEILETLFLGTVDRAQLEGTSWADVKPIATLLELCTGRIGMRGKGANKALYSLEASDQTERAFLESVGSALECRVPDSGVKGIALPVEVLHG